MSKKTVITQTPQKPNLNFGFEIEIPALIEDYADQASNIPIEALNVKMREAQLPKSKI